jgi:hypothetical protein
LDTVTRALIRTPAATGARKSILFENSVVFENVAQLFFQLPLRQDVLDPAPSGFAAFDRRGRFGAPFGALQQRIEIMGFLGFTEELFVDVEMFVFAFAHFSRKALEINGIEQAGA